MSTPTNPALVQIEKHLVALTRGVLGRKLHQVLNQSAGVPLERSSYLALVTILEEGEQRVSDLALLLNMDFSTVSRLVRRLTDQGLVDQRADPRDHRAVLVQASEHGIASVRSLQALRRKALIKALADWAEDDIEALAGLLARFTTDIESKIDLVPTASGKTA